MQPATIKRLSETWKPIPETPKDPILHFNALYAKDPNPKKANLAVGAYADDDGKPWVLPSVQMAIKKLSSIGALPFGYLGMTGDLEFTAESVKMAYGFDAKTELLAGRFKIDQIARTQTLSGTGAVNLAYALVQTFYKDFDGKVWTSNPTWPIHNTMAKIMGIEVKNYFYYDLEKRAFDSRKYIESLKGIPEKSFVVLHCSGHNPTGYDVTDAEWQEIANICKQRGFVVLMDTAYQGFVTGDLTKDGLPIRLMAQTGVPIIIAQSYAKNMGLYGQRTGCLSVPCNDAEVARKMTDFFGQRNRNTFSNPPRFGSDIAKTIFKDPKIYAQWRTDIKTMADNINLRRTMFLDGIKKNGCPGSWEYIKTQRGMFAFTQLKAHHAVALREKYSIYMTENGRISITGLNTKNIDYITNAISEVMKAQK